MCTAITTSSYLPQTPAPVPGIRCPLPGPRPPPLRVRRSAETRAGKPGRRGLCPRCWNAYLIHHVHVGQQQHQQCGGREEPVSKGGRGGWGRSRRNNPDGRSSAPRAPASLATRACVQRQFPKHWRPFYHEGWIRENLLGGFCSLRTQLERSGERRTIGSYSTTFC